MVQWSEQTIERGEMRAPACSLISSGEERDSGITTPSIWKVSARSAAPEKCREIRGGCWGQKVPTGPALSQYADHKSLQNWGRRSEIHRPYYSMGSPNKIETKPRAD